MVPFAGLDLYGILHVTSRRDMIQTTIKMLEYYLNLCQEQAKKSGPAAGQIIVIFDMEDFNLRPYMWRPGKIYFLLYKLRCFYFKYYGNYYFVLLIGKIAGEVIITLIQMYEANYPEILKTCFIINGKYKVPKFDLD